LARLGDNRADAPSGDAVRRDTAIAAKPVDSPLPDPRGSSTDAPSAAPVERQASDAATSARAASSIETVPHPSERVTVIRGQWPWLALVLMAIVLGPLWLRRRTKKLTSAQQARQRLRPS
jgi:hypothetical protein